MSPTLALVIWFALVLGLLWFDPAKNSETSFALWVPVVWMFIMASRLPSQWLGLSAGSAARAYEEGNPLDRTIYSVLILLSIVILIPRLSKWSTFFTQNFALITLISFALLSVVWSDFPLITLKRWFRDLGNYLVVLVVLSDPWPVEAVGSVLRRMSYILISLSILLVKYFPSMGKQYDPWTGADMFVGATMSKNMLGVTCLVSGIFFFWDIVTRWSDRKERRTKRIILLNVAYLAMTLWLLNLSSSATSRVCFVVGCVVILAVRGRFFNRHRTFMKVLIPATFCFYLILAYGFDINGQLASTIGRDPTLTGRANIWHAVLSMHTNPILGVGYESFWLGPRLRLVWLLAGQVNEAHNGYLEIYLNLGLVGISLLAVFLVVSYRTICRRLDPPFGLPSLCLALWTVLLFYNMTESSAFRGNLLWVTFLSVLLPVAAYGPVASGAPITKQSEVRNASLADPFGMDTDLRNVRSSL